MPPPASQKALSDAQQELLKQWIAEGATYEGHWAFESIRRPAVPGADGAATPVRNPIDAFVRAKLAAAGIEPSPEADRRTLIRR